MRWPAVAVLLAACGPIDAPFIELRISLGELETHVTTVDGDVFDGLCEANFRTFRAKAIAELGNRTGHDRYVEIGRQAEDHADLDNVYAEAGFLRPLGVSGILPADAVADVQVIGTALCDGNEPPPLGRYRRRVPLGSAEVVGGFPIERVAEQDIDVVIVVEE